MIEKSITENALLYYLECPLRSNGLASLPESPVLQCSQSTLRWLMSELACCREPTAKDIREYFDNEWQQTNSYQSCNTMPQKKYFQLLREGLRACHRLRLLLCRCEILQPVSPYELVVDGIGITGEYTVLRSSHHKRQADVLYLRYGGVKIRPVIPDVVSFARWVDASKRMETQNWDVNRISVMHYWVNRELAAEHRPGQNMAGAVLEGVASVVSRPPFPIVSEHCLSCPTRSCNLEPHETTGDGSSEQRAKPRRKVKRGMSIQKVTGPKGWSRLTPMQRKRIREQVRNLYHIG